MGGVVLYSQVKSQSQNMYKIKSQYIYKSQIKVIYKKYGQMQLSQNLIV